MFAIPFLFVSRYVELRWRRGTEIREPEVEDAIEILGSYQMRVRPTSFIFNHCILRSNMVQHLKLYLSGSKKSMGLQFMPLVAFLGNNYQHFDIFLIIRVV